MLKDVVINQRLLAAHKVWDAKRYKQNAPYTAVNEAAKIRNLEAINVLTDWFAHKKYFTGKQRVWAMRLIAGAKLPRWGVGVEVEEAKEDATTTD